MISELFDPSRLDEFSEETLATAFEFLNILITMRSAFFNILMKKKDFRGILSELIVRNEFYHNF